MVFFLKCRGVWDKTSCRFSKTSERMEIGVMIYLFYFVFPYKKLNSVWKKSV